MSKPLLACLVFAACGGGGPRTQTLLQPEMMRGPAAGPAGRTLVITATCGSLETECRNTWAPTVDQIVLGALEFRGYATIDPQSLRKDERQRDERIEESESKEEHQRHDKGGGLAVIGIIPVAGVGGSSSSTVRVTQSRHKTIVLQGASYEDLRLEDKQQLMQLAGATSVATTRVVVGANYGVWSAKQNVEVIVKLADANTGEMRWSTRCIASSTNYPTVENAIENAARCAASGFTLDQ